MSWYLGALLPYLCIQPSSHTSALLFPIAHVPPSPASTPLPSPRPLHLLPWPALVQMARKMCREIVGIIKTLKAARDMSINEIKLVIAIEDPRAREKRGQGIEVCMHMCWPAVACWP